jgi:predicted amidohydrolase
MLERIAGLLGMAVAVALCGAPNGDAMAEPLLNQTQFAPGGACRWEPWAPRDEISPVCVTDAAVSRTGADGSLRTECRTAAEWGGWRLLVDGVKAGQWYRFDAYYRPQGVAQERRAVLPRLDWLDAEGARAGQPEFVYHTEDAGDGWRHVWALAPAPKDTAKVRIELFLGWSSGGTIWWDDVSLSSADPPAPRPVKIATVFHRPSGNTSAQQNVEEFCRWIDRAARSGPDVIVLPEGMTMVGTGLSCADVAEPIPGPTSARIGEMARTHHCYIVACYNEREGKLVYNTAILVDRTGRLVGKSRKLYLPRDEVTDGVTPGRESPVFDTDFGKVGLMICWDVQYPEPAQRLALQGAEIIFLPIWGGNEQLVKARAIEDQVYVVTCGYDIPSMIVDLNGKVLASAPLGNGEGDVAIAEVDLSQRNVDWWQGDLRATFLREHRDDLE